MAVAIRLTRVGATKRPAYRVIAIDKRRSRDGRALEILGFYDPLTEPATVQLDREKIDAWIGKGALPSDTVVRLMRQAEATARGEVTDKPKRASRPAKPSKKALAKAAAAEAAPAETAPAETAPSEETAPSDTDAVAAAASTAGPVEAATDAAEAEAPETPPATDDAPVAQEEPAEAPADEPDATPAEAPGEDDAPAAEKADA